MRQRIGWRMGVVMAAALPGMSHAQAPAGAVPTWFAVLPDVLCGVAALALAGFGLWLLYLALAGPDAGEFSFRRHAGGFGGSSTGWQVSQALARLLAGLALVLLALALTMARLPLKDDARPEAKAGAAVAEAKAASSAASAASASAATAEAAASAASAK
jgi:hypothetical protein